MPVKTAKNHFLGKDNLRKLNCAQAVINSFREKYSINHEVVESFHEYGGGRAPEGMCGAYYAGVYALEKSAPEKLSDYERYFENLAGSVKCRQIRELKKLSCVDCVAASAEYLHSDTE